MSPMSDMLRAYLARANVVLSRIGEYAHDEDCPAAMCDDNDCDCPRETEEGDEDGEASGDRVHDRLRCRCMVWTAEDLSLEISGALASLDDLAKRMDLP